MKEKPREIQTVKNVTPLIVKEAKPDEMPPKQSDLENVKIATVTKGGDKSDDVIAPPAEGEKRGVLTIPVKDVDEAEKIYLKVEIESTYPGGLSAWARFLNKKLANNYPDEAIEKGIQGRVVVRFVVDREGNVSQVEAIEGPEELRAAAVNVIRQSGKWIPAEQNGMKVKSYKRQPVVFQLDAGS